MVSSAAQLISVPRPGQLRQQVRQQEQLSEQAEVEEAGVRSRRRRWGWSRRRSWGWSRRRSWGWSRSLWLLVRLRGILLRCGQLRRLQLGLQLFHLLQERISLTGDTVSLARGPGRLFLRHDQPRYQRGRLVLLRRIRSGLRRGQLRARPLCLGSQLRRGAFLGGECLVLATVLASPNRRGAAEAQPLPRACALRGGAPSDKAIRVGAGGGSPESKEQEPGTRPQQSARTPKPRVPVLGVRSLP